MAEAEQVIATVCAALDGPFAAHGFAGGQGGVGAGHVQVLFCCAEDDFRARHPDVLPDPDEDQPWGCVDLVIDLHTSTPVAVADVRLETERLMALLARRGHVAAAEQVQHLGDLPVEEALARLPGLLLVALEARDVGTDVVG